MRFRPAAVMACLILAAQGCNLQIPTGLLKGAGGAGATGGGDCASLFFKLDVNGDKFLSEDEYVKGRLAMAGQASDSSDSSDSSDGGDTVTVGAATQVSTSPPAKHLLDLESDLRASFKALDTDGDGKVSQAEFLASCSGEGGTAGGQGIIHVGKGGIIGPLPPVRLDCNSIFKQYDKDHNGKWSPDEFQAWAAVVAPPPMAMPAVCAEPAGPPTLISNTTATVGTSSTAVSGSGTVSSGTVSSGTVSSGTVSSGSVAGGTTVVGADGSVTTSGTVSSGGAVMMPPQPCYAPPPPPPSPDFHKADANQDGAVSPDEFCSYYKLYNVGPVPIGSPVPIPNPYDCSQEFNRRDLNHDGALTLDEFLKTYPYAAPGGAPPAPPTEDQFKARDRNGDGKIDAGEYCNELPLPPTLDCKTRFQKYDRDQNGQLSWDEYFLGVAAASATMKDAAYTSFKLTDRNADGSLSVDEFCNAPPLPMPTANPTPTPTPMPSPTPITLSCADQFKKVDANADGSVSFDEWVSFQINGMQAAGQTVDANTKTSLYDKAKSYDTNADGSLSYDEFSKTCAQ